MMKKDVEDLLKYMKGHHDRLDLDIDNALKKRDIDHVQFYEGAKNATELFISLLQDVITKNDK
jgi:hypothetical protein